LVDENYRAKVADFGLSRLTNAKEGEDQTAIYISKNDQGPVKWMAPVKEKT